MITTMLNVHLRYETKSLKNSQHSCEFFFSQVPQVRVVTILSRTGTLPGQLSREEYVGVKGVSNVHGDETRRGSCRWRAVRALGEGSDSNGSIFGELSKVNTLLGSKRQKEGV